MTLLDAFQNLIQDLVSDRLSSLISRPSTSVGTTPFRPMSANRLVTPEWEYADECYRYLVQRERQRQVFHCRSPQESYRDQLLQRIEVLCLCNRFSDHVKYLSVYILDYFMDNYDIREDRLELVVICSLMIAAKVDENDIRIPKYSQLFSEPNQYSLTEANLMEEQILKFFNWTFLTPTVATYIDYFYSKIIPMSRQLTPGQKHLDHYLDRGLDIRFYQYRPSLVAAAIIYCVREKLNLVPVWTKAANNLTNYSVTQMIDCVKELKKYERPKPIKLMATKSPSVSPSVDSGISD